MTAVASSDLQSWLEEEREGTYADKACLVVDLGARQSLEDVSQYLRESSDLLRTHGILHCCVVCLPSSDEKEGEGSLIAALRSHTQELKIEWLSPAELTRLIVVPQVTPRGDTVVALVNRSWWMRYLERLLAWARSLWRVRSFFR
jgi:hypothetical protein